MNPLASIKVAVVVPCFRVTSHIVDVLSRTGPEVDAIYVVDDGCPDRSGNFVITLVRDPRVRVIHRAKNGGVGAATLTGMAAATQDGAKILVKLDGDGQMDPTLIPGLIAPIVEGRADYCKGNRFFSPDFLTEMPVARVFGNAVLSFLTKLSSGYWTIFDPTNGFLAIHAAVFSSLPQRKIDRRYFFESDLLFRLNLIRAHVVDYPMQASYKGEESNLRIRRVVLPFLWGHLRNFSKRIMYSYFVRDFSVASLYLLGGLPLLLFGVVFGAEEWISHAQSATIASAGTVMLAALPIMSGFQLILGFLAYDVATVPRSPIHTSLIDAGVYSIEDKLNAVD